MKPQTSPTSETLSKDRTLMDYSGKTIYVGIDVHGKDYQVAKLCNGICLGNHRMSADAGALIKHLRSHYPGAGFKCVYECCAWGFNLQRRLTAADMECMVVHAADVATTDKERRRKTDTVDALKLARNLANGELKALHVPDTTLQKQRDLMRYRGKVVGDITRSKNRLKSLLKFEGIEIPPPYQKNTWSRNFLAWVEQQAQKDPVLADTLLLLVEQLKFLRQLLLKTEKKLRLLGKAKYAEQLQLAISVPGIGPTVGLLFLLEVGDVRRFKGFDALNDFVGFCPDKYRTGETNQDRGLTCRRHKKLRSLLIEAAWQAIRIDPALMDSYETLCKRMKGAQAIIRIARKLLRRLRAVLLTGVPYQKGVVA